MARNFNKFLQKMRKNVEKFSFLRIDISFAFLFFLMYLLGCVRLFLIYLFFIILHEMAHLFVAKRLGYLPARLRLSIFGASLEGYDDFSPNDEIKIVLAGPCFNFLMINIIII